MGTTAARRRPARSVGPIVAAAAIAIMSAFVTAIAVTLTSAENAERSLPPIVARDVTAIAHATALRSDLQQAEQMLAESTEGHPWEPGAMRRTLESIDRESLLTRTGYADRVDGRLRSAAFDAIAQARSGIDGIRAALDGGDTTAARRATHTSLRPQIHHADAALAMLLQASMDEIGESVQEQANARRQSTRLALLLDALCVVVAFVFGSLAIVAVRREHARLRTQVAELEVFADRVAHDIRGPLTPVLFALQEAARDAAEPLRGFLVRGRRSLRVVEEIVDGLHSFARSSSKPGKHGHTQVCAVIEDVVAAEMAEAELGDIQLSIGGIEEAVVDCEPGVLASIVSNLLRNAVRHMGKSTTRRVSVRVRVCEDCAVISVEDTGPGLPPGFEARAFLPYVRHEGTQRSGLGLGLATVKRLAEGNGGSVHVDSTALGCTFSVELPLWRPVAVSPEAEPVPHG